MSTVPVPTFIGREAVYCTQTVKVPQNFTPQQGHFNSHNKLKYQCSGSFTFGLSGFGSITICYLQIRFGSPTLQHYYVTGIKLIIQSLVHIFLPFGHRFIYFDLMKFILFISNKSETKRCAVNNHCRTGRTWIWIQIHKVRIQV